MFLYLVLGGRWDHLGGRGKIRSPAPHSLDETLPTYMQFLAAKSLWISLLLAKYSIPLATWMHMSTSLFLTSS